MSEYKAMLTRPEFRQSRETQILFELFSAIEQKEGGLFTWPEIETATGKSRRELGCALRTAIRRIRRDLGLVIENDRRLGYRLRPDNLLVNSGRNAIERARRTEKVGLEKMDCCEVTKLAPEERAGHMVVKAALQLGLLAKRPRVRINLTQMVIRKHNALSEQELMEAIVDRLATK